MPLSIDIAFKWGKKKDPAKPPDPPTASTGTTATSTCSGSCTTNDTTTDDAAMKTVKDGSTMSQGTQQFVSAEEEPKSSKSTKSKKKKSRGDSLTVQKIQKSDTISRTGTEHTEASTQTQTLTEARTQTSRTKSSQNSVASHTGELGDTTAEVTLCSGKATQSLCSDTQHISETAATSSTALETAEGVTQSQTGTTFDTKSVGTDKASVTGGVISTVDDVEEVSIKSKTKTPALEEINEDEFVTLASTGGGVNETDSTASMHTVESTVVAETREQESKKQKKEKSRAKIKPIVKPKPQPKPKPKPTTMTAIAPSQEVNTGKTQSTEVFHSLAQSATQTMTQEYVTAAESAEDDYVTVKTFTNEEFFTVDEYYSMPMTASMPSTPPKPKAKSKKKCLPQPKTASTQTHTKAQTPAEPPAEPPEEPPAPAPAPAPAPVPAPPTPPRPAAPGESLVEPGMPEITAIDDELVLKAHSHLCPTQTTTSINTGEENSIDDASTQSSASEVASPAESPSTLKPAAPKPLPTDQSLLPRRLLLFRHAERMDRVFPSWLRQANSHGTYKPYNTNQPRQLPKRRRGLPAFEFDPPVTEVGRLVAQLAAKSVRRSGFNVKAIYCSPALRCIETAHVIVRDLGQPDLRIRVEPGLFDWFSYYESAPVFLTAAELLESGYPICKNYRPIMSREVVVKNFHFETKHDYYRRAQDVIQKILSATVGTVVVVAHATTLDGSTRALLDLPKSVPSDQQLDRLADRYPYCASVTLEQQKENGLWRLGRQLLPITFLNQTTKFDRTFLLRK